MLSPRKINQSSPTKQNNSPCRKLNDKKEEKAILPEVLLSAIHELQTIIYKLGSKVPHHLTFGFSQPAFELIRPEPTQSTANVQKLEQEIRQLKIKLNNYQFELKKNSQDTAQFRLKSKLQRDKQTKKLKSDIARLQMQLREDNSKWEVKIQQMRERYQQKYKKQITLAKQQCQKIVIQTKEETKKQVQQITHKCEQTIQKIQTQKQIYIQQTKVEAQVKIQIKQKQFEQQKQKVRIKHVESIQKLQKKQQQILTAFDSEKKMQQKKKNQQKIAFNKLKQKLYNDLYIVRKQKEQLCKVIEQLKLKIYELQIKIKQKVEQKQNMQEQYKLKIIKINQNHKQQIQKIANINKDKNKQILKEQDKKLQQFQKVVQKLNKLKEQRQMILKESQLQIETKFEQRPSKTEDTEYIQKLNHELFVKQEQLNNIKNELKINKLQRQNNQKNYTRIFSARAPPRDKSYCDKERTTITSRDKDKQRVAKIAKTVDFNYILKVCNKNF